MSSQTTTPAPGTVVKAEDAGAAQIRIIKAVGGWTVTAYIGADMVDGWTGGYTTRRETKAAFDHAVAAFTAHGSLEGINRRRQQLIADRDQAERRYDRTRSNDTRAAYRGMLADIDTKLAQLDDLWTRTQITSHAA